MSEKQKVLTYPSPKDLKTILSESVNKSQLMTFLSKKGIYCYNITTEELAERVSELMLDADELNTLRAFAYRSSNKQILSGFTLKSESPQDLNAIYENLRNSGSVKSDGYTLKSIHKISKGKNIIYEGSLTYVKKAAGRIEFIRTEERDVSFVMKKIDALNWHIEVDGGKSNDGKIVYNMLNKNLKDYDIKINMLRIDRMTRQQTIDFFDRLAKEGLDENWNIEDIEKITLKQKAGNIDDPNDEESSETEMEKEQLTGITQAILEGKNLRENIFVKKAEDSGYAFTSMTYIYHSPSSNSKVKLRAEFKGSPKIFEVCMEEYMKPLDNGNYEDSIASLSDEENLDLRSQFWNNANKIYRNLLSKGTES